MVGDVVHSYRSVEVDCSDAIGSLFGDTKTKTVKSSKAQPLYIDPKLEIIYEHIPSLIKAGGKISGTLAGQVSLGSKESGGSKSGIYGPSGGGISSGSDNYSQVADEPQSPDTSGAAYIQNKSAAGARAFEASDPKASKFAPPKIGTRQTLAQLSFERSKAVDATSGAPVPTLSSAALITMDEPTLTSLAEAIADSYAPPPMPTAPEITWEFEDPEITAAVGEDFTKYQSPGRYFIEETSPVFTDPGVYFSTDNFINRVDGFEPKKQAVHTQQPTYLHFGDSMKQMDFVRRQMVNLTGHAWLEDQVDYAQEIKNLYEAGIRYGKAMKLSAGVSLSKEQVDALQDDIVWAETKELRGNKVVIPRLYVAKSKREKKASGLLARNIDIDAGSIINNGSSIIGENVNLKAHSDDIINKNGGDIYGSNHLGLYAARDIKNIGSSIASDGDMVLHAGRNIENITESKRYGDEKNHVTTVGKQSTIKAKGPLALFSGGDLLNKGSSIESGGLHFDVFGNMINDSIEDSYASEMVFNNGHRKERSVVYRPATISSSGSTKGFVAGNFALIGSRMSSTGDSDITVGGKSMLISQVNSKMLDTYSKSTTTGVLGGDKDHISSHQSLKETLAESSLTASGKNVLINNGEQVLEGAKVHGESGVYLKGSKTSLLAARLRNMQSDYEYHEGIAFNSTDADGYDNTTHAHSSITGNEVVVDSEAIEADYTRQFGLKDSGSFFTSFSDVGLSDTNKPAWAKQVEASGKSINWNPLDNSSKSWSVHKEVLNQEFTTLVSLAAAVGTMAAGGFGVFAAGGATAGGTAGATAVVTNASMMSTIGTAMGQSALVGLASKGSVSLINNQFDLSKVAGDLTSKESLKGLGLNMATAGLTAGIGHGLGFKDIAPGLPALPAISLAKPGKTKPSPSA